MIFKARLAELIADYEKTATRRRVSENPRSPWFHECCRYRPGQVFAVQPGRGKARICDAVVTCVYKQRLGAMTYSDAQAEGFYDLASFRVAWEEINGSFDADEVVHVIEFRLIRPEA